MHYLLKVTAADVKEIQSKTPMRMSEAKLMALANAQTALLDRVDSFLTSPATDLKEAIMLQNEVIRSLIHVYNPE
jgi:hypothetical protein